MARKVIVSKFKFFILKLWEFARLFRLFQSLLEYIYIYVYVNILWGKKDATIFSRQACFVIRFTLQGFNPFFFPLKIFIPLCFNVLSTVPRENRLADSLYVYVYIFITYIFITGRSRNSNRKKITLYTLHPPNSRSFHSSWM